MSKNYVSIPDLVVADFRSANMGRRVESWRVNNHVPYAESCARQIWYGARDVFASFPMDDIAGHNVTLHHGAAAYMHLLRLNLGLLSRNFGETNIAGQFYAGWQKMHNELPEKAKPYDVLVQHLTADSRLIRGRILSGWQTQSHELAARDLSGMKSGDSVLIIAAPNKEGKCSPITDNLARKLSSNDNRRAREIAITHPDPEVLKSMFADLKESSQKGRVPTTIQRMDFDDLAIGVEMYDRVYITIPMGENPEMDAQIIAAWKGRETRENTITHLRADYINMAEVSQTWTCAGLDNYVGPDRIRDDMTGRARNNDALAHRAEEAVNACTTMRLDGVQPSAKLLAESKPAPVPACN